MKRTNLVLDEDRLKTVTKLLGAKTYSAAVNQALSEVIGLLHIRGLEQWFGSGLWDGNLSEMREDTDGKNSSKKRKKRKSAHSR